jgi:hypothetical protein
MKNSMAPQSSQNTTRAYAAAVAAALPNSAAGIAGSKAKPSAEPHRPMTMVAPVPMRSDSGLTTSALAGGRRCVHQQHRADRQRKHRDLRHRNWSGCC